MAVDGTVLDAPGFYCHAKVFVIRSGHRTGAFPKVRV